MLVGGGVWFVWGGAPRTPPWMGRLCPANIGGGVREGAPPDVRGGHRPPPPDKAKLHFGGRGCPSVRRFFPRLSLSFKHFALPEMVKFASNFCYCAANQEKAFLNGNGPLLAHLPFQWPEMVKFALIALAKPSVEGPCRALHAEGYPLPERTPKMIGMRGDGCDPLQRRRNPKP